MENELGHNVDVISCMVFSIIMGMNLVKTIIYARCSTDETKQDVNNQLQPLRDYAKAMEYELIGEFVDYVSGGDSNRPRFQQMMKDAVQHKFNLILIWSLDRFSREGILNTLSYIKILKRNNVGLKSLQEHWLDTSDSPTAELLLAIMSWVGQQERKRISERTRAGLARAKKQGKKLGRRPKKYDFARIWKEYEKEGSISRTAKLVPYGYGTVYDVIKNNIHNQQQWERFVENGRGRKNPSLEVEEPPVE